jgi:transposase
MNKKRRYTDEFKQEVLAMAANGEKSIPQLARDLGINDNLIYRWRQRYRVDEATDQLHPSHERALEAENRRLRRELEIARQERDVLKKAIQIFSQDQSP